MAWQTDAGTKPVQSDLAGRIAGAWVKLAAMYNDAEWTPPERFPDDVILTDIDCGLLPGGGAPVCPSAGDDNNRIN